MRFGAVFWMHRTTWPALRDAALAAERSGFDAIWTDDHLIPVQGDPRSEKFDAWTLLAAIGALTTAATVGPLVSSTTFRSPTIMAKMATTLDHVTGGRAILGLGSGYYELEHRAMGLDFGTGTAARLDRLEEAASIIRPLLHGEEVDHVGRYFRTEHLVLAPTPVQPALPIIIGGMGRRRLLAIAARYADLWNAFGTVAEIAAASARLDELCLEIGRDPAEVGRTVIRHVAVRDDEERAQSDWSAISARHMPSDINPEELQIGGSPAQVADAVQELARAGFGHMMWVFRDPYDFETMERLAEVREELSRLESADPEAGRVP